MHFLSKNAHLLNLCHCGVSLCWVCHFLLLCWLPLCWVSWLCTTTASNFPFTKCFSTKIGRTKKDLWNRFKTGSSAFLDYWWFDHLLPSQKADFRQAIYGCRNIQHDIVSRFSNETKCFNSQTFIVIFLIINITQNRHIYTQTERRGNRLDAGETERERL